MEISEYTLMLAEEHRAAKAAYYAVDENTPPGAGEAAKHAFETTMRSLAWSVLDDIDKARKAHQ